jgi:Kdo2-lipid IVA lauroyltransferase/acyltransferase
MYYLLSGFLYLLSLLPLRVLYVMSDGIYGLVFYIIGYRKKVVLANLRLAFPEKTEAERVRIAKDFYHNLIDTFIEMIKIMSVSQEWLMKRFTANWEVIEQLYDSGKSCQLQVGHTFNWEWGHLVLTRHTRYPFLGVYMPIGNKAIDKLFYKIRDKFDTVLIPATKMREAFLPWRNKQYLLGLAADQNPGHPMNAYWVEFFGRLTPFVRGPEKGAREWDVPVIFGKIVKPKRGYYYMHLELAETNPTALKEGELTRRFAKHVEASIRADPDMWLWSHRRWKWEWKEEYEALRVVDEG